MRMLRRYALLAASLMLAPGLSARAEESVSAPLPCPTPCAKPCPVVHTAAPKVIVEVPPPNVIVRQAAETCQQPACAQKECFLKQICHFGCKPHATQSHFTLPLAPAYAPTYAAPTYAAPMYAAPVAPTYAAPMFAAPTYAAPTFATPTYAAPTFAAPTYAAPTFAAPTFAPPVAPTQPVYVPVCTNPAPPVAPPVTPPTAPAADTCDAALKRITAQMETLTKVVEVHTTVLTSHEDRLKRLEKWAVDSAAAGRPIQLPELPALPK